MLRLSIVIPCVHEAERFDATLASVLQNRPDDCEVLVIQPRSYDDPYELKEEVRFIEVPESSTLVDLVNAGVTEAVGEIVHVLSCDVEVTEGWTGAALPHFNDPTVGSVAPLVVTKGTSPQVVSRGVRYGLGGVRTAALKDRRARLRPLTAPTLTAGLYRRQAILDVGGFFPGLGDDFADVDLGLMLQVAGYRCVHEEDVSITIDQPTTWRRLSIANGRAAEQLFWRNTQPGDWANILVAHPLAWLCEITCSLHRPQVMLQLLGRLQGWLQRGTSQRQHQRHLQTLPKNHDTSQPQSSPPHRGPTVSGKSPANSRAAA